MAQVKVKLVKSLIGCKKDQIATAQALGLKKVGKVAKIVHLIEVSNA